METSPGFPEEEHYDPNFDRLRCFGIGTSDGRAIVVPFRSVVTGEQEWYGVEEQKEIMRLLRGYLASPAWPKGGWNSRVYDAPVVKRHFGVLPTPNLDGIALHRVADPELPHSLGFVGGMYTDVDKWKAGHTATKAATDEELWQYNATDTVVTAISIGEVSKRVRERGQVEQAKTFAKLMDVCRGLHENGIAVDQVVRKAWDRKLLAQAQQHRRRVRGLASMPALNPGSAPQLSTLLFEKLKIAPYSYSEKSGEPSTEDDALRAFLSSTWDLEPKTKALITAVRDFRRVVKRRGVVVRLRPITDPYFEDETLVDFEETAEERAERFKRGRDRERACGLVLPDGRVHADWLAHGTVGWRFSSSGPNLQNLENKLRDMFVPAPGNVFVGCDEAQLELRMVAGLARDRAYLDTFNYIGPDPHGADPHWMLCVAVFGDQFLQADKDQQKKLRRCMKELTYGCAAKGTRVVTLGAEGAKPIEELAPGVDYTWCWDGARYVPTMIKAKWSRGVRDCVRVTFKWGGRGNIPLATGEAIFTIDHHFILRDGTDRAAGDLCPRDRLMPFGRWPVGSYRMVDPHNDGGRYPEHRVVLGLGPDDLRPVHHRDENGRNNQPDNLQVMESDKAHAAEHWDEERREQQRETNARLWADRTINEKLAAGRRASPEWRAANEINYRKMRAGLDRARAEGRGTTKGQRRSRLEAMIDKIGVLPDSEIANMARVTREAVFYFRKTRGISRPPKKNHEVVSVEFVGPHEVWDIEVDHPAHNFAIEAGIFVHNSLYGAEDETKHEIVTSAEDENERLIFPDFSLREVSAFTEKWKALHPEIPAWWDSLIVEYRRQKYLVEPVMGLRLDFLDGEDPNKLYNYKAQSGGAALVHKALFRFLEEVPIGKWGPGTGLIQQGHDSLVVSARRPRGRACRSSSKRQ